MLPICPSRVQICNQLAAGEGGNDADEKGEHEKKRQRPKEKMEERKKVAHDASLNLSCHAGGGVMIWPTAQPCPNKVKISTANNLHLVVAKHDSILE